MDQREWLAGLKPGDEVALWGRFLNVPVLDAVERITKSQVVVAGTRFWKKNGSEVGYKGFHAKAIGPMTDEHRFEMKKRDLRKRLERIPNRVAAMTKETVDRWMAFLDAEGGDDGSA